VTKIPGFRAWGGRKNPSSHVEFRFGVTPQGNIAMDRKSLPSGEHTKSNGKWP